MKIGGTHKLAVCRFQLWLLLDIFGTAFSQTVFKKFLFHGIFGGIHTQVQKYILQTSAFHKMYYETLQYRVSKCIIYSSGQAYLNRTIKCSSKTWFIIAATDDDNKTPNL